MIVFTVHHDTHCPGQTLEETLVKSARPEQPVESSVGLQPFRILHCTTRSYRQFYQRQSVTMKFPYKVRTINKTDERDSPQKA